MMGFGESCPGPHKAASIPLSCGSEKRACDRAVQYGAFTRLSAPPATILKLSAYPRRYASNISFHVTSIALFYKKFCVHRYMCGQPRYNVHLL